MLLHLAWASAAAGHKDNIIIVATMPAATIPGVAHDAQDPASAGDPPLPSKQRELTVLGLPLGHDAFIQHYPDRNGNAQPEATLHTASLALRCGGLGLCSAHADRFVAHHLAAH